MQAVGPLAPASPSGKLPDWHTQTIKFVMASALRLILADHDASSRSELRRVLSADPTLAVVGQCATAAAALSLIEAHHPDLLLLDMDLAQSGAYDVMATLGQGRVPTLALASEADNLTLLNALAFGARGVVMKSAPSALLLESIRTVASHRYWVTPEQLPTIIESLRSALPSRDKDRIASCGRSLTRPFGLTPRELDIVAAIAEGQSNKEIAERLAVKECTVKHHVSSVFDKVGVFSRLELAMFALHHNLVPFSEFLR